MTATPQLATEPPDGSVVRIIYSGGAFDPDYLARADEQAALSGWPDGQHWYPIGDDTPEGWNSVLNAATGNDAQIEVLRPVDAVRAEIRTDLLALADAAVSAGERDGVRWAADRIAPEAGGR